jgi:transposase-like protein
MDQKRKFVEFAATEGPSVRELCRRFGISPTAGYKLRDRYQERRRNRVGLFARALLYAVAAVQKLTSTAAGSVRI